MNLCVRSALVSTLAGMALANIGVLPPGAPELHVVYKYLLPLAIPMLLFSADLRWGTRKTGGSRVRLQGSTETSWVTAERQRGKRNSRSGGPEVSSRGPAKGQREQPAFHQSEQREHRANF